MLLQLAVKTKDVGEVKYANQELYNQVHTPL